MSYIRCRRGRGGPQPPCTMPILLDNDNRATSIERSRSRASVGRLMVMRHGCSARSPRPTTRPNLPISPNNDPSLPRIPTNGNPIETRNAASMPKLFCKGMYEFGHGFWMVGVCLSVASVGREKCWDMKKTAARIYLCFVPIILKPKPPPRHKHAGYKTTRLTSSAPLTSPTAAKHTAKSKLIQ